MGILNKLSFEHKAKIADILSKQLQTVKADEVDAFVSNIAKMRVSDLIALHSAAKNLECVVESDRKEIMADVRNQLRIVQKA